MTTPNRRRPPRPTLGQRVARVRDEVAAWKAWQKTVRNDYPRRITVIDRNAEKEGR